MAVRTYNCTDSTQLTVHFNVQEFKCKCGSSHKILISEELVSMLEKLYSSLDCSKIIVNSGYRCSTHDKNVGGNGCGQHTKGTAADIVCYSQDGNPISSKMVCCTAQDIGFNGIANIDSSYTAAHVDVRSGSKWYGDETKGNGNVTNDFYKYYGILKNGNSLVLHGIDVSEHQGNIEWSKVKQSDEIDFAILRAGYGREYNQIDKMFEKNYKECKRVGMPCGAYWYSYACSVSEAEREAEVFLSALKGKSFEYPVFFDLEESKAFATGIQNCSDMVTAFCTELEKAGYFAGLYISRSPLQTYITDSVAKRFTLWIAEYSGKCNYSGSYGMWQYSSTGRINGINSDVDLDKCYIDYPSIIESMRNTEKSNEAYVDMPCSNTVTVTVDGKTYTAVLTEK